MEHFNKKRFTLTESDKIKRIMNHELGKSLNEQEGYNKVDKIDLPNGTYVGDGSGYEYMIKDKSGDDTGYKVKASIGIRGMVDNDEVVISNGVANSKTWGKGGEYSFKNVGYKPKEVKTITNKIKSEGIKNVSSEMINSNPFRGTYGGHVFGGEFNGVNYQWDANGVDGMSGVRGMVDGYIITENNSTLSKYGIDDADETGVWVGFHDRSSAFACYKTTSGTPKCNSIK